MNDIIYMVVSAFACIALVVALVISGQAISNRIEESHIERMKELGYVRVASPTAWSYSWVKQGK